MFEARIAFGSVNSVADLSMHEQLRRVAIDTPSGRIDTVAPPVQHEDGDVSLRPVPALGQHSEQVRGEFADPN